MTLGPPSPVGDCGGHWSWHCTEQTEAGVLRCSKQCLTVAES